MKVLVSGACGKMSRRIISMLSLDKDIKAVYGIEKRHHKDIGKRLTQVVDIKAKKIDNILTDDINTYINDVDVIIEFTTPEATLEHLNQAKRYKKAIVIGTTGFNQNEILRIKTASSKIPVFLSPNMSLGVNLVFGLLEEIARSLPKDYSVEIVETHHRFKKDAPSGTAKKMAEIIAEARGLNPKKSIIYGRYGYTGERPLNQIGVHAVRGGSVVGRHEVKFISDEEQIEIIHSASSRDAFARGAVIAAKFVYKKKKGLYTVKDLI